MECFFKTVNKKNCISFQRCEGIYKLALNLGGNEKFAQNYSKYILRLTILHKLRDKSRDTNSKNIFSFIKKKILKVFYNLFSKIFYDTYKLENLLSQIESQIELLEEKKEISNPMVYFNKVGEGYGLIFKYAAVGARAKKIVEKKLEDLGKLIGALVALRDSIIDLEKDIKKGNFNPFKRWEKDEILLFYRTNVKQIKYKIENLTEFELNESVPLQKERYEFSTLRKIVTATISPAIMVVPNLPSATVLQTEGCCDSCSTSCSDSCSNSCSDCCSSNCEGFTCDSGMILPIVACLSISCVCLCILGIILGRRKKNKGGSGGGGCGGGGGCDCSGCDCSGCDCS